MENDKWLIRSRPLGYLNTADRYIMKLAASGHVQCYMRRSGLHHNESTFI